jgi:hypothetical protein
MKHFLKKISIAVFLASIFFTSTLYARTCADQLKRRALLPTAGAVVGSLAIPLFGAGAAILLMVVPEIKNYRHAAAQLNAATVITQGLPENKIEKAHQVIDDFYDGLLKTYPQLTMIKEEVIALLNRLNSDGLNDGYCSKISLYSTLEGEFFPDDKAQAYMNVAALEKARFARNKIQEEKAAQIRREKENDVARAHAAQVFKG